MEVADGESAEASGIVLEEAASQTLLTGDNLPTNHKCEVREVEKIIEVPIEILGAGQPLSPRLAMKPIPVELQVMRTIARPEPVDQILDRLLEALTEDLGNSEQHISNLIRRIMLVPDLKHSLERVLAGQRKTW